ncbi:MAG: hypothetical protein EA378_07480 [Phycisphaerales bacterium]|nr:MAG: hypothetical protein EA378_07480 [Phycisphaerales bacterium]
MTHARAIPMTTPKAPATRPLAWVLGSILLALAVLTPRAHAQAMQDVEPYVAVVTSERVPLRSGDMRQFYQVAELEQGKMLLVVAESGDWARVRYPSGLRAYLAQEDGVVDGQTLTLIRPSRLRAVNQANADPTASWKPLLAEPLPVNTALPLVGRISSRTNREFYLVEAPAQAVGYVTRSALRRATEAEASSFQAQRMSAADQASRSTDRDADRSEERPAQAEPSAPAEEASPTPEPAAPRDSPREPVRAPAPEPATEPEDDEEDDELLEPMVRPGDEPAPSDDPARRPIMGDLARERPAPVAREDEPEVIEQRAPGALERAAETPEEPAEPAVMSINDLEAAFQAVLAQPVLEAEVDELLTEIRRVRATIDGDAVNERLRAGLDRRIAMLELRRDYRRTLRQSESSAIDLEASEERLARRIEDLARTDVYAVIGTLQASSVYDGQRLPLLYRVRSVGDGPVRTLGYIAPTEDLDLLSKLGRIVGVVGFVERDTQRNILMLRARRVNVIDPSDLGLRDD